MRTVSPAFSASSATHRTSRTVAACDSTPAFFAAASCGFLWREGFLSRQPSTTALYPSRSAVRRSSTRLGPTSSTVTPTMLPLASKIDVMPTLRPIRLSTLILVLEFAPARRLSALRRQRRGPAGSRPRGARVSHLDADVDARRHVELGERVHRLRGRFGDEDQALVRPDLELLAALLVDVGRAQHGEAL